MLLVEMGKVDARPLLPVWGDALLTKDGVVSSKYSVAEMDL